MPLELFIHLRWYVLISGPENREENPIPGRKSQPKGVTKDMGSAVPTPPLVRCVTSEWSFNLSGPQFPSSTKQERREYLLVDLGLP